MTEFLQTEEFEKDLRKLMKKFNSLDDDLDTLKKAIEGYLPDPPSGTVRISGLGSAVKVPIYKVRKFRCRSLKGKGAMSGLRVIYAYDNPSEKIFLIEIYYKGNQENEDRERILKYFSE